MIVLFNTLLVSIRLLCRIIIKPYYHMTNSIASLKVLSSVAVLRSLAEKSVDIYQVLFRFIKQAVDLEPDRPYKLSEIKDLLNKSYGFDKIPESVISKCLSLNKSAPDSFQFKNKRYHFISNSSQSDSFAETIEYNDTRYQRIIDKLYMFTNEKCVPNRDNLEEEFLHFLYKNNVDTTYSIIISEFLEANKSDSDFIQDLNKVREGMLIYQGLTWNGDGVELKSWNKKLNLILSTEFLYYLSGCEGPSNKSWAVDLLNLVEHINSINSGIIQLKILPRSKADIQCFFENAKLYFQRDVSNIYVDSAMKFLLTTSQKLQDIIEIEAKLNAFYSKYNIIECDEFDDLSVDRENILFTNELDQRLQSIEPDDNKRYRYFEILRNVKILRNGNRSKSINKCGYIFVTQSYVAKEISKSCEDSFCQLSISLSEITNYLWSSSGFMFRGNKEFLPSSFSIFNKAYAIISRLGVNKVIDKVYSIKSNDSDKSPEEIEAELTIYYGMLEKAKKIENNTASEKDVTMFYEFNRNSEAFVDYLLCERMNKNEKICFQKEIPQRVAAMFDKFDKELMSRLNKKKTRIKKELKSDYLKPLLSMTVVIIISILSILFYRDLLLLDNVVLSFLVGSVFLVLGFLVVFIFKYLYKLYVYVSWCIKIRKKEKNKEERKKDFTLKSHNRYFQSDIL